MARRKFTQSQIDMILADYGVWEKSSPPRPTIAEFCLVRGVSKPTLYKWIRETRPSSAAAERPASVVPVDLFVAIVAENERLRRRLHDLETAGRTHMN